ncbi:hypothetical protein [Corynebacterium diphtheriae]|uniref:hypothetical protein n=1 Tax=Corynebacterium diphtheriae TaxID=1717 RepID=UPI000B53B438|nr:hypothetical protein [Corynebacterium diphtheriae]OWX98770.1 hypothetical protein B1A53_07725 [Corynebacterium diphtheriae]CAB0693879.1 hypothetical protein FRC0032_01098 [Corynebacterium diphtheriae]CAB0825008.1 hypothetical protein FRC0292_01854 [Corynebacterium diphtheriae]
MNGSNRPKTPPVIPKDATDDRELTSHGHSQGAQQVEQYKNASAVSPKQPEPKNYPQWLDQLKFQFGKNLIGWCLFLVVGLSLIDFFWDGSDPESNALGPAIELLRLVTTTALGFVFAKSQFDDGKDGDK